MAVNTEELIRAGVTTMLVGLVATASLWAAGPRAAPEPSVPNPMTDPAAKAGFSASLLNAQKKARDRSATVEVKVSGVQIVDPDDSSGQPKGGQAHVHYRLDKGPVVATTATKLSFHELSPGPHKITVVLAAPDHSPLTPEQTLEVRIPEQ